MQKSIGDLTMTVNDSRGGYGVIQPDGGSSLLVYGGLDAVIRLGARRSRCYRAECGLDPLRKRLNIFANEIAPRVGNGHNHVADVLLGDGALGCF